MEYMGHKLRHEKKYLINQKDYWILSNALKKLMKKDSFSDENGCYHVRSLYFDDVYDSSLYEKNSGVFARQKYRIRIYNLSDSSIKFECKLKYGEYISKESKNISKDTYYAIMDNNFAFLKEQEGVLSRFYIKNNSSIFRPKVIVDYEREAYTVATGDVRITFDKELRAGFNSNDIFDPNLSTVNVFEHSIIVLEVKYNNFIPSYIQSILNLSSYTRSAVSKYLLCRVLKNNIYQ